MPKQTLEERREKNNARMRAHYAANRKEERARLRARYAANSEKLAASQAAYRKAHPEKVRAEEAAYRAAHPEKLKFRRAEYRAAHVKEERAHKAAYRAAHVKEERARIAAYLVGSYRETLERSERRGETWEPSEDKIVMNYSLTINQISLLTARTTYAVKKRRTKLVAGERERSASIAAAQSFIEAPRAAITGEGGTQ